MFVIKTQDGRYYNGRANLDWNELLGDKVSAFQYGEAKANRRAVQFNSYSLVSGFSWSVEKVN